MARTVPQPIVIPADQGFARQEIAFQRGGGGMRPVVRGCNAVFEQCRAPIINDYRPGTPLCADIDEFLYYRPRLSRAAGAAVARQVNFACCLTWDGSDDWGVGLTEPSAPSSAWINLIAGVNPAVILPTWFPAPGVLNARNLPAAEQWADLQVTQAYRGTPAAEIYGVYAGYRRNAATLGGTTLEYSHMSCLPIDDAQMLDGGPVSVARELHMQRLLRRCYEDQVGQICTAARARGQHWIEFDEIYSSSLHPPTHAASVSARFQLFGIDLDAAGNGFAVHAIESGVSATNSFGAGWGWSQVELVLPYVAGRHETFVAIPEIDTEVLSVQGHWLEAVY